MNGYEYLVMASEHTKGNGDHWFRYLRKVITKDGTSLTSDEVQKLLETNKLSQFQKITLEDALTNGTRTHDYIVSLNQPAKKRDWKTYFKERTNG